MNRTAISNFTAGEFTPQLMGRFDLSKFHNSYEMGENCVPRPFGGMFKRTGFEMIAPLKFPDTPPRLIEFEFSTEMSYVICCEHLCMRFFTNTGGVVEGAIPGEPYEIETPYIDTELKYIRTLQSEDIMYIIHPNYPVKKLVRYDTNDWQLVDVDFVDGPFADINQDAGHVVTFSAREGMITLTSNKDLFSAEMVDAIFKAGIGCLKIIAVTDARNATAFVTASIAADYTTDTFGSELLPAGAWTVASGSVGSNTQPKVTAMNKASSSDCKLTKAVTLVASKNYMMASRSRRESRAVVLAV